MAGSGGVSVMGERSGESQACSVKRALCLGEGVSTPHLHYKPTTFFTMGQDEAHSRDGIDSAVEPHPAVEMGDFNKQDISHVERVLSPDDDLKKEDMDFSRVDKEVQMYASRGQVEVDEATNKRLKRMIDRRVLVIMICTYFLQALDKGTMSFSSIMGIKQDAHLEDGQKVGEKPFGLRIGQMLTGTVLMAHNLYLHCGPNRRIPDKLDHSASSDREIFGNQYLSLGYYPGNACRLPQLRGLGHCANPIGYLRGLLSAHLRRSFVHVV